jgi:hypothetical protein
MRSTQLISGALAVAATSALIGLGAAPGNAQILDGQLPDPMTPGVTHESGIMFDCTGKLGKQPIRVNLYENRTYGNYIEAQYGEGDRHEVSAAKQVERPFLRDGRVRGKVTLAGKPLAVTGTATPTKSVKRIRDVVEDAGLRIVSRGTHRRYAHDLTVSYRKHSTRLNCDPAVAFRLKVTKTSITD